MRFIKQNSRLKLSNIILLCFLCGSCLLAVSCQTKQEKVESALKRCQALLDKDDLQTATTCYGEAVKINPETAGEISQKGKVAVYKKCVSYKERKDYERAIICFDGFTALEPQMANNYFQLADSYYQYYKENAKAIGRPDFDILNKAEEAVLAGLKINPKDVAAHDLYGELLKEGGKLQQAIEEYKKVFELDPTATFMLVTIGSLQEKLGRNDEAIKSYKKVIGLNSDEKTIRIAQGFLAILYERLGKNDEAIEVLEKLNAFDPNYDNARERLESLKKRKKP